MCILFLDFDFVFGFYINIDMFNAYDVYDKYVVLYCFYLLFLTYDFFILFLVLGFKVYLRQPQIYPWGSLRFSRYNHAWWRYYNETSYPTTAFSRFQSKFRTNLSSFERHIMIIQDEDEWFDRASTQEGWKRILKHPSTSKFIYIFIVTIVAYNN